MLRLQGIVKLVKIFMAENFTINIQLESRKNYLKVTYGKRRMLGQPTEAALMQLAQKGEIHLSRTYFYIFQFSWLNIRD